jgi:hypothetical protein
MERDYYTDVPVPEGETWIRIDGVMRNRGGKVYRYDENVLVAYMPSVQKGNNIIKYMETNSIAIISTIQYSDGVDIYFQESDLVNMESILGIIKSGSTIPPESIKNHKFKHKIREDRKNNRTDEENERLRLRGEKLMEHLKNK